MVDNNGAKNLSNLSEEEYTIDEMHKGLKDSKLNFVCGSYMYEDESLREQLEEIDLIPNHTSGDLKNLKSIYNRHQVVLPPGKRKYYKLSIS